MIDMQLTRQYFDVKDVRFEDTCSFAEGILTVSEKELQALTADLFKAVGGFHLEITHPGENARIIHVLDTIAPMVKVAGEGIQYSGFFSTPYTVGRGVTNMLCGFAALRSWKAPPCPEMSPTPLAACCIPGTPSWSSPATMRTTPPSPRPTTW